MDPTSAFPTGGGRESATRPLAAGTVDADRVRETGTVSRATRGTSRSDAGRVIDVEDARWTHTERTATEAV